MNRYKCVVTDVNATAAAAAHPDGAYVKWTDHVAEVERLKARLAEAELAIVEHNDGCEQACMAGAKDRCLSYTSRNLQCPDCPRDWMITYDAARADDAGEGGV